MTKCKNWYIPPLFRQFKRDSFKYHDTKIPTSPKVSQAFLRPIRFTKIIEIAFNVSFLLVLIILKLVNKL